MQPQAPKDTTSPRRARRRPTRAGSAVMATRAAMAGLVLVAMTAGCARLPQFGSGAMAGADWPALEPLGPLVARGAETGVTDTTEADVAADGAALRARAAALRARPAP